MEHKAIQAAKVAARTAKTQVLAVGDWKQREFAAAKANIADFRDWSSVADINAACDLLRDCQQPPELIFLAQPLPGIFRQGEIDHLQQLVPLTRLVIVAGSWCEGELRTGAPPSGVIRLYWYELASWWQAAVRRNDAGQCPHWSLPLDHMQAGRWSSAPVSGPGLASVSAPVFAQSNAPHSVLIDADYAVYETLADALRENGIKSYWKGDSAPAAAGIWDGGQLNERELSHLTHFCRQTDGPVIALLDFPRIEHLQQAQAAGAAAVFAKPYIVEEVVAEMVASLTTLPNRSAKSLAATPARAPASSESD